MAKYIVDCGHTLTGAGTGAVGYAKETDKNREVGKRLIQMLQEKGHTVVNATVDKSSNDLADRVAIANRHKDASLFISLHLNAYKKTSAEMGVETYVYTGANKAKAQAIQSALVSLVGWKDRKVKEANFYVLRQTSMPAVLVELGFCDSQGDMAKWNTEKIAKALFKGMTGVDYTTTSTGGSTSGDNIYYRVICGSYKDKANAEAQQKKLKEKGFDSFLEAFRK